jgi:hypothetical protein
VAGSVLTSGVAGALRHIGEVPSVIAVTEPETGMLPMAEQKWLVEQFVFDLPFVAEHSPRPTAERRG